MKKETIAMVGAITFVLILICGCPGIGGNNNPVCPASCTNGCISGTSSCNVIPKGKCENITCTDKCVEGIYYHNGVCLSDTGKCSYASTVCPFGCEAGQCKAPVVCPSECPYGCKPNTVECIEIQVCPSSCSYGCVPGTSICNQLGAGGNILNGNFETGNYSSWHTNGTAFGSRPSNISDAMAIGYTVTGFEGRYWASSYLPTSDRGATGTLTSNSFIINKPYLEFLAIGQLSDQVYVELASNGNVLEHTEIDNPLPPFKSYCWDLSNFVNSSAVINVVDNSVRNYIEVDDFVLQDTPTGTCGGIYVDPYRGYTITPPENWVIDSSANLTSFYGPVVDNSTVYMSITSESINSTANLELYVDDSKKKLETISPDYQLVSDSIILLNGMPAHMLVYNYTFNGMAMMSKRAIVFNPTRTIAYSLTGTALQKDFPNYGYIFEASFQTFSP